MMRMFLELQLSLLLNLLVYFEEFIIEIVFGEIFIVPDIVNVILLEIIHKIQSMMANLLINDLIISI